MHPDLDNPLLLVGKKILHKFFLETGEFRWYHGAVTSYNPVTRTHELVYEGELEHQHYDLTENILEGDILSKEK